MKKLSKKVGLDYNEVKDVLSKETLKNLTKANLNSIKGGQKLMDLPCATDCLCSKQDQTCQGGCQKPL